MPRSNTTFTHGWGSSVTEPRRPGGRSQLTSQYRSTSSASSPAAGTRSSRKPTSRTPSRPSSLVVAGCRVCPMRASPITPSMNHLASPPPRNYPCWSPCGAVGPVRRSQCEHVQPRRADVPVRVDVPELQVAEGREAEATALHHPRPQRDLLRVLLHQLRLRVHHR